MNICETNGTKSEALALAPKLQAKVIENPRLLEDEVKTMLGEQLLNIAADGFMRTPDQILCEDVLVHSFDCDRLVLISDDNDRIKGFIASNVSEQQGNMVYYLGGVVLEPELQGRGFAYRFLAEELSDTGADVLCFHTQSGSMRKLGSKLANHDDALALNMFPSMPNIGTLSSGQVIQKGRYFDRYHGSLYGDQEAFAQQAINDDGFDFSQGDAIIFAGYVQQGD